MLTFIHYESQNCFMMFLVFSFYTLGLILYQDCIHNYPFYKKKI